MCEYVGNCICVTRVAWNTWGPFMCAGTKGPEMDIYIYLCVLLQETNHVKRVIKSLIVGTTSLYIGRERNCATDCPRIPYFGTCLGEKR